MRNPHNEALSSDIVDRIPADKVPPELKCVLTGRHDTRGDLIARRIKSPRVS